MCGISINPAQQQMQQMQQILQRASQAMQQVQQMFGGGQGPFGAGQGSRHHCPVHHHSQQALNQNPFKQGFGQGLMQSMHGQGCSPNQRQLALFELGQQAGHAYGQNLNQAMGNGQNYSQAPQATGGFSAVAIMVR
jgi:hypothetical protein